jgi:protein-disulfide isomerase
MPKKATTEEKVIEKKDTEENAIEEMFQSKKIGSYLKTILKYFQKVSTTQVLIFLLIVASFLIGVLVTKVYDLQKQQTTGNQANANPQPAAKQPSQQAGLTDGQKVKVGVGDFPAIGNNGAKVTIVEFADFRCPFCERFFTDTLTQIKKDYIDTGKAKFFFRNFPFLGDASTFAANAAECANDQGKFWEFHDYLYKNQPSESDTSMYNTDTLTQAAINLGMDGNTFRSCLNNKTDSAKASKDLSDGQAAGVSGTPTLFVDGTAIIGAQPYSVFKTLIDQELKNAK